MSKYAKTLDASDPKEVVISRGILRRLIQFSRLYQKSSDDSDIPAFVKMFGPEDAELLEYLESENGIKQETKR